MELTGPRWSRGAYLRLGGTAHDPQPLFTCSLTGNLEFLLPPGRFEIYAYSDEAQPSALPVEIKPEDRELLLGTIRSRSLRVSEARNDFRFIGESE